MKSEKSLLLQLTGDMPLFRIVDFLVDKKGMDFTKKDIAEGAQIARASLFNYWPELETRNSSSPQENSAIPSCSL